MRHFSKHYCIVLATALLLALVSFASQQIAQAMFMVGNDTPIDRLVDNINAYLKNKPKDSRAFYLLGRVHALAYATKCGAVRVYDEYAKEGQLPVLDENNISLPMPEGTAPASKQDLRKYLAEAVNQYYAAIRLEPKHPLYYHSLASLIETAGDDLLAADVLPLYGQDQEELATPQKQDALILKARQGDYYPLLEILLKSGAVGYPILKKLMADKNEESSKAAKETCADLWREETIEHYWKAYTLCTQKNLHKRNDYPVDYQVGIQSAVAYVRLIHKRGPTDVEKHRLRQIEIDIGNLSPGGAGAITPIILHDAEPRPLADLLSDRYVTFDINGDDIPDRCPWLKPDTALLVWDPNQTGQITSGRQLFGSVTWWIFWKDGYEALKALDDNQDGELAGNELKGLALWKDKNQNGISEENEVQPIEETEIQSLSTESTQSTTPGPSPANPQGLKLKNGRALPTYDWTFTLG